MRLSDRDKGIIAAFAVFAMFLIGAAAFALVRWWTLLGFLFG